MICYNMFLDSLRPDTPSGIAAVQGNAIESLGSMNYGVNSDVFTSFIRGT